MIHPDTEMRRIDNQIGFGVFATAFIPRGTITWVKDELDLVLSPQRLQSLPKAYLPIVARYSFLDAQGNSVLSWDFSRYMNHSCDPTTTCLGSLCDMAKHDLQPGDQLTCEYAFHNLDGDFRCSCGAAHCRGVVKSSDLAFLAAAIDAETKPLVAAMNKVRQPLLEFLTAPDRQRVDAILSGREAIPSCLENAIHP